jgi:predicted enzyme related to lactoylglutathione lyase
MTTAVDGPAHTLGSYIAVDDARRALDFYVEAFDARRRDEPYVMDDGRIGHTELVVVAPFGHRWMVASSPAPTPPPRHGEVGYLSYAVPDAERAKTFYGAVLGWRFSPGNVENSWQIEGPVRRVHRRPGCRVLAAAVMNPGGGCGAAR